MWCYDNGVDKLIDGVICNWYLDRVLESDLDWKYGTLGIEEL